MNELQSTRGIRICGHPDVMEMGRGTRKWARDLIAEPLRWYIRDTLRGLSLDQFASVISDALDRWVAVCRLAHVRVHDQHQADTVVTTGRIDGQHGTLAWWELPSSSSNQQGMRLTGKVDQAEYWYIGDLAHLPNNRIDLTTVLAHEAGHLLGLGHTNTPNQLMNPTYNPDVPMPHERWDTRQAQDRYGPPVPVAPPEPPPGDPGAMVVHYQGRAGDVIWRQT